MQCYLSVILMFLVANGLWFSYFVVNFLSFRKCQENVVLCMMASLVEQITTRRRPDHFKVRLYINFLMLDELKLWEQSLPNKLPTKGA